MFRFSLRTLVLLSLWAGAAMWVWRLREPWAIGVSRQDFASNISTQPWSILAPDGLRVARVTFEAVPDHDASDVVTVLTRIEILDYKDPKVPLAYVNLPERIRDMSFRDDDTLDCTGAFCCILHRRFPEWWWGHFYRPEVWVLAMLTCALLATFVRGARLRGARHVSV